MSGPSLSRFRWDGWLRQAPRWLLVLLLVYAPLAFGCTRPEPKQILAAALLILSSLFIVSLVYSRRWPRVPRQAGWLSLALLAYGWGMTLNARQEYDADFHRFFDIPHPLEIFPGAVDLTTAASHMILISGLLGAFWVACDAGANPVWRNRFWLAICLTGTALLAYGLLARFTGLDILVFQSPNAFASYRYHANAGAFINLVLPFLICRAFDAAEQKKGPAVRAFWSLATLLTVTCGFINVSRVGAILTALILVFLLGGRLQSRMARRRSSQRVVLAGAFLAMVAILVWAFGTERAWSRWPTFMGQAEAGSRYLVYEAIWTHALPVSGWWGFGPGTFQITFPFFTHHLGDRIAGIWRYAHCDYLQTIMEWGWAGAALWATFISSGLWIGCRKAFFAPIATEDSQTKLLEKAAFFSAAGICLHALVDFPLQIASLQLYTAIALALLWSTSMKRQSM